jgi:hypothetical protein
MGNSIQADNSHANRFPTEKRLGYLFTETMGARLSKSFSRFPGLGNAKNRLKKASPTASSTEWSADQRLRGRQEHEDTTQVDASSSERNRLFLNNLTRLVQNERPREQIAIPKDSPSNDLFDIVRNRATWIAFEKERTSIPSEKLTIAELSELLELMQDGMDRTKLAGKFRLPEEKIEAIKNSVSLPRREIGKS